MGSNFSIGNQAKRNLTRKLNKVDKQADRMIRFGVSDSRKAQGRQIKAQVSNIKKSGGKYQDVLEQLREIGQAAFKNENKLVLDPPDVRAMREMYFSLNEAMIDSLKEAGRKDLARKLIDSDKALTELFDNKDLLSQIGNKKLSGEQIYKNVIGSGNVNRIEALKSIVSPEAFTKLKGTFIDDMLKRNSEELISWGTSFNRIRNKKPAMQSLFAPQEITDINDLLRLGIRGGQEVLSTSGTGPSNFFTSVLRSIPDSIANESALKALKDSARSKPERIAVDGLATTILDLEKELIPQVGQEVARKQARNALVETIQKLPINKWGPRRKGLKALQVMSVKDGENGTK